MNLNRVSGLRNSVEVEVAVLGHNSPYDLCGRKATLNLNGVSGLRNCVKVEVAVLGSPSIIVCMVSVDVKEH